MKITKTVEAEILNVLETYYSSYLNGDLEKFASVIDPDYKLIGTSEVEVFNSKAEMLSWLNSHIEEVKGNVEFSDKRTELYAINDLVLANELAHVYSLADNQRRFYSKIRISTLLRKSQTGWKVVQQHGSLPDVRTGPEEWMSFDTLNQENLHLREVVQRRTAELEIKNRELKIEAALERVRARTMAMHSSEELLETGALLFQELSRLDINIFNCGYVLMNEEEKMGWNYGVNPGDGTIRPLPTGVPQTGTEVLDSITESWKKQEPCLIIELDRQETIEHQTYMADNMPNLSLTKEQLLALTPERLVIHTFNFIHGYLLLVGSAKLTPDQQEVVLRFANVFEMTYRRFLDLQQAEAQGREAEIQLALERIRARSLAMHKSEELSDVISDLFRQFDILKFNPAFAHLTLFDGGDEWFTLRLTDTSGDRVLAQQKINLKQFPEWMEAYNAWKEGEDGFVGVIRYDPEVLPFVFGLMQGVIMAMPAKSRIRPEKYPDGLWTVQGYCQFGYLGMNITRPPSTEDKDIVRRFAKEFGRVYRRFIDLQKAEAQAREAQIEVALERVRAKSLAMHKSEELAGLSSELVKQVEVLGVATWFCAFNIYDDDEKGSLEWGSNSEATFPEYRTPREGIFLKYYEAGQRGETLLIHEIDEEACPAHYEYLCSLPGVGEQLLKMREAGFSFPTSQIDHVAFHKYGYVIFITFEPVPQSHEIFKRFAKVFEQTYTRFLDLQRVEAQAREAQIEAALERVRARSMAMQKSEELSDVATVLFRQLRALGGNLWSAGFVLLDSKSELGEFRMSNPEGEIQFPIFIPNTTDPATKNMYKAWQEGVDYYVEEAGGNDLKKHYDYLLSLPECRPAFQAVLDAGIALPNWQQWHAAYLTHGYLLIITLEPSQEAALFKRFAKVFEQTYTRFLDLQKAEAQTREAQIEAALERVRARSMAMHRSEELVEVATVLYKELRLLDVREFSDASIVVFDESKNQQTVWGARTESDFLEKAVMPLLGDEILQKLYDKWRQQDPFFTVKVEGLALQNHINFVFPEASRSEKEDLVLKNMPDPTFFHCAVFSMGYLELMADKELSSDSSQILTRFAKVFEQTYTRFLDLQKAEAQAREAQIEAALEKVRSRTMAMQKSEDLEEVIHILFNQFVQLKILVQHTGFLIDYENREDMLIWLADEHAVFPQISIPYFDSPHWNSFRKAKKTGQTLFTNQLNFEEKNLFYRKLFTYIPNLTQEIKDYYFKCPGLAISTVLLDNIGLYIENFEGIPYSDEENSILLRFGKVFQQTYTRFLDLQKAEAQAREAQIEASLEKVRSRTMAMQKADELHQVVTLVVEKLMDLGVILDANGVILCTYFKDSRDVLHWIASPDFSFSGSYLLPYFDHPIFKAAWESKLSGAEYFSQSFSVEQKNSFFEYAFEHSDYKKFPDEFKNWVFQNDKHSLSFAWSENSAILIPSHTGVLPSEEDVEILKRFAKVFEQAYVRFMDLQRAEKQANLIKEERDRLEVTLQELQATQSQLIQAEKMASLGELTAGIAHEIKNPLNFVNNFSELSSELLDEMVEEIRQGDQEEAFALVDDLKQNLKKILEHGKRADGIVKGMLMHSRGSSNQREMTNVNTLCEEYLRLAYHGLRAKDKTFNAGMETDFDLTIPDIEVVSQDIGRVILNLITNAFYACTERSRSAVSEKNQMTIEDYQPKVSVSTRQLNGKIQLIVSDNGPGIPDELKDKIFQPFFTTKPTGQGTGLGLSLSYDIVKAHGGDLKVESKEGEGSRFIIELPVV